MTTQRHYRGWSGGDIACRSCAEPTGATGHEVDPLVVVGASMTEKFLARR
jgi:hypothetical protein